MFEFYDCSDNKVPENRYLKMNEILNEDFIRRRGIDKYNERKDFIENEGFEIWKNTILNTKDYYINLYIVDNDVVAFICFQYVGEDVVICEIQIIEEYKGKDNIFRKLLLSMYDHIKDKNIKNIIGYINDNNDKSRGVFTHVGMVHVEKLKYQMPYDTLVKYLKK